jgi:hypothetical protein
MIARPKISRNERKTTEIGACEVGNFAPFCCPGKNRDYVDFIPLLVGFFSYQAATLLQAFRPPDVEA